MKLSERLEQEARMFDKGVAEFDPDTASLLREAAALARRVEEAPVRSVLYLNQAGGVACYVSLPENLTGKRVRIVEE